MEDNFNQNEFEEFLQNQVRNHRMYPNDAVWREIDKKLHGEKRWPALTIAALLLLTVTVLICIYFTPKPNIFAEKGIKENAPQNQLLQKSSNSNLSYPAPFDKQKTGFSNTISKDKDQNITSTDAPAISSNASSGNSTVIAADMPEKKSTTFQSFPSTQNSSNTGISETKTITTEKSEGQNIAAALSGEIPADLNVSSPIIHKDAGEKKPKSSPADKDYNDKNMVDNFLKEHNSDISLYTASKKVSTRHKFSYLIYAAPSVSYRKLVEDHSILKPDNTGGPVGINYVTDVNKVVRHKPGTGMEAGFNLLYSLSDKVRLKTGFQFNMRQYSIEAYRSNTELASIALAGRNGVDTINTLAIYRNNNGFYSTELVNRYFQLSMPLGIEWEIIGSKKIKLNVAGSIQPTYLLNRNAYLLSTNFKNYTESPQIVRQWNLNSNIEAFISFKVGDFKWQLGPQLRYQPYSTYIKQYPIKEHLMDYGIKIGVSKAF